MEELELMPEVSDYYIGAEILLPRGDQMARGHVVTRKIDAKGNVMGRSHTTRSWIQGYIKLSSPGAKLQH